MPKNLSILLIASLLMTSLLVSPAPTQAGEQTPTTAPVPTGWWSAVQEDIRQSEYQITWQAATYLPDVPAAYQAPNRAHDLRTYFTPEGAVVIPRVWPEGTDAPSWQLGLGLLGCAGADSLAPDGNRIEYRRDGLREWYVNDEDGLAWHVALFPHPRPPAAGEGDQGGGGEVSLALASPQLTPRLADDGTTVEFLDPAGSTVLHYGPFTAVDAAGRSFPVALDLLPAGPAPGLFTLHVSLLTLPLSTPVTLTTLLSSPTGLSPDPDWSAEGDQLEAHFGSSVSSAGDVDGDGYSDVLVGAFEYDSGYTDEGAAFLYYGSAAGLSLAPGWSASGGQAAAAFGYSVGLAGDVDGDGYGDIIVGAPLYDNGENAEGRAYVYHGSPGGPGPSADWIVESGQAGAQLGQSVALAGDVDGDGYSDVIVGAHAYSSGEAHEGAAFVYHGGADGLSPSADWIVEGGQEGANLGQCVDSAGDVDGDGYSDVIVGAYRYDNGENDEGRAYVYHGSAAGLSPTPAWTAESDNVDARYGFAVGTAGDVNGDGYADVIVGAYMYSNNKTEQGAAFVYHGSAIGLGPTADWSVQGGQETGHLGISARTAGDVDGDGYADVVVGVQKYSDGQTEEGRALVYHGSPAGLSASHTWAAEGNQAQTQFGYSVGSAGDVNGDGYSDVIVGAFLYDDGETDEGAAFLYYGSADNLSATPGWTAEGGQDEAYFGESISTAGDVNGDGYADVVVGAYLYDNGQTDEGAAFLYYGSPAGLSDLPGWSAEGDQEGAHFGRVSSAGDVNGDGYADLIVGAALYDSGETNEGRAYVYHGSPAGPGATADWTVESDREESGFGYSVSSAGDVNGDGYSDVLVGASLYDHDQTNEGAVFAYYGSADGLHPAPDWSVEGEQEEARLGAAVSTAGDVNRDGYADVLVGAPLFDHGQTDEGRAFVYYGSAEGLGDTPDWTAEGNQTSDNFGFTLSTAGDVNGDGYADVVIAAPQYDNGEADEGRVFLYYGAAGGLEPAPAWTAEGGQIDARFGSGVSSAGDVDGDGYADVLVGAKYYDGAYENTGRIYLYLGSATGPAAAPDWSYTSDQEGARLGVSVSTAGDVNGDGYADVIAGAPKYDDNHTDEGRAYLFYGSGDPGLPLLPRQLRTDGAAPIAPLGLSDDGNSVQLRLTGRSPLGRDLLKLQWQVAPLGTPFSAAGIVSGTSPAWTDPLTGGVVISQVVTGLEPLTPHHWRVRLLYHPGSRLGQAASRWLHVPWNGWSETDFRTPDETIAGLNAANDGPTVLGEPTTLSATVAAGTRVSYIWRVDGGTVISGPVVTHTYPAPGSYTALVTASNPVSLLTATTTVRVEQPLSGLSAANDSPTQLGNATLLSATVASGSNPAYAWAFGDGSQGGGAATAHFYPSAGIYTAMVTASNGVSLLTATTVVTIEEGNLYLPLLLRDWSSCFPGPWEEEPNDTLGEANGPLCADIEYLAYPDDPDDYFYFTPAAGQVVVELWDYVPGSLGQMILYDDQGGVAGWDNDLGDGGYIAVTVETGTYWLRVYTAGGFTTDQPYRFSASFPW